VYVATAPARDSDPDWAERVKTHRSRRAATWTTVEAGGDPTLLLSALAAATVPVLVDDIGNWLTAALDAASAWDDGAHAVEPACTSLVAAVSTCAVPLVLVSPEVGWGVLPATRAGRIFADAQGRLNQHLAAACDRVTLVVAGLPTTLK
jgi:adenosylcobinamide kinase/adenosylcobinamide-phosphate guanylyltransferase